MARQGEYGFEVDGRGHLTDTEENFDRARKMFLDWSLILWHGGPGTVEGDGGSWHVLCHLAGAAGVFQDEEGRPGWAGITFDAASNAYVATFSFDEGNRVETLPIASEKANRAMTRFTCQGYIEGASRGHILDRNARDAGDRNRVDRRQDYDMPIGSNDNGGPVWEHWCTSRDIVSPKSLGSGMLREYLRLVSVLGGRFPGVVARGRIEPEYSHLMHLRGMVRAGFLTLADVQWDTTPLKISSAAEKSLNEARPADFVKAARTTLKESGKGPRYHMFSRRIASFVPLSLAMQVLTAR